MRLRRGSWRRPIELSVDRRPDGELRAQVDAFSAAGGDVGELPRVRVPLDLEAANHAATITRAFQDALGRAGLPRVRFHDLRHSAATFLLSQGFGLEDVKNLLGHSTSC